MSYMFAIDPEKEEVIVSSSPKGSNTIDFVERVSRKDNEMLYHSVVTLTSITRAAAFDASIFKAADKLCQLIYAKRT